jgi:hypothetical protein
MASARHVTPTSLGLHEHRCVKCGKSRPCYSIKCQSARNGEDPPWTCSACLAAHEDCGIDVELPPSLLAKLEKMAAADDCRHEDFVLALIQKEWKRRHGEKGVGR